MIPKWLYYLLNVTAYPLAIYLAIWLSNNVRYDPQGMAGGYQMLYYAMVAVVICFIVSLFASYKLVGSCWPAVIVLIGFIVMLFLWYSIMTSGFTEGRGTFPEEGRPGRRAPCGAIPKVVPRRRNP